MPARPQPRIEGTLTVWNADRGFGFIAPTDGGPEIFVHIRAFSAGMAAPEVGQRLTYEEGLSSQGKRRALRVAAAGKWISQAPAPADSVSYLAIPAFLALVILVAVFWQPPIWPLWLYLGMSIICFAAYGIDKQAAIAGRWRLPESTLLLPGLLGGWPGAIIGQQVYRHKTKKTAYLVSFWGTVVLNVILLVLLCSPPGQDLIHRSLEYWVSQL